MSEDVFIDMLEDEPLDRRTMNTCPTCPNDLVCHDLGECKQPPAPDYGEPWQIGIMGFPQAVTNSQGKIMAGNSAVARAVACVNACAGISDPAAHMAAMREAIREAHKALQELEWEGNEKGTRCIGCGCHCTEDHAEDCKVHSALIKLRSFLEA